MSDLASKTCVPCRGGVPPLQGEALASLARQVDGWEVVEEHHIRKPFKFPDFRQALKFVNQLGEIAEEQGHHPTSTWPGEKSKSRSGHTRLTA